MLIVVDIRLYAKHDFDITYLIPYLLYATAAIFLSFT